MMATNPMAGPDEDGHYSTKPQKFSSVGLMSLRCGRRKLTPVSGDLLKCQQDFVGHQPRYFFDLPQKISGPYEQSVEDKAKQRKSTR